MTKKADEGFPEANSFSHESVVECDRLAAHHLDEERTGAGVEFRDLDAEKAMAACELAIKIEPDSPRLKFQLGRAYERAGLLKEGAQAYQLAAKSEYAAAMASLGMAYENGKGVLKNDEKALAWLTRAAQKGNVRAMTNLGAKYEKGEGVIQDYAVAMEWYRSAASRGFPAAFRYIANVHRFGRGQPKDMSKDLIIMEKGAILGDTISMTTIATIFDSGDSVEQNSKKQQSGFFWRLGLGNCEHEKPSYLRRRQR